MSNNSASSLSRLHVRNCTNVELAAPKRGGLETGDLEYQQVSL